MARVLDSPALVFALSFFLLWLATRIGVSLRRRASNLRPQIRDDFSTIQSATLTLSGLIIGFTFSMAISRYELRKGYEEAEANAIGTEYLRADLLPAADAGKVRPLLRAYLDQRISFYLARTESEAGEANARTAQLVSGLWAAVRAAAAAQPTPVVALAVAGMNDVFNSQGYTQAAWWNRIPAAAWIFMAAIACVGNVLVGYGAQDAGAERVLFTVLPCVLAISFLLIADIESPRGGIIRVKPQNLTSLAESLVGGTSVGSTVAPDTRGGLYMRGAMPLPPADVDDNSRRRGAR
jgi:hypothetical protein